MIATNIAAYALPQAGITPKGAGSETINGTGIDRMTQGAQQGWLSCILSLHSGAATGSPSSYTVDCKLQESDSSGSGYTDISGAAVTQQTAAGFGSVAVNLKGCKRYIRAVVTVAITGGTSPTVPVSSTITLGGAVRSTATSATA